ncbi:hypothetical protein EZL74_07095 [Flavobacterium silvisoli]|uniref:Uncharacterized protein n=1 Tax=Flavobacterium silvisoli TaxID=2529433 RepID=A0A4Q9Z5A8_9FLAO|nr:hypothetical protein [Flavobacterium silvisoli]TBX69138.1 hypothetical protein EZL74_07095 [Flavobacterium silvisoli]
MEELDLLKKAWKKDNYSFNQVTENEIYSMIHKRSSSIVKWILIISILEFVFWNIISILYLGDGYIRKKYGNEIFEYIKEINTIYNIINYTVVAVFIYLFYKNYKRISTTTSTKQLMSDILKTRKTVIYYVWFNILFFVVGTLVILYVQLNYDSKFASLMQKIHDDTGYMTLCKSIGIILGFMLLIVIAIWLFYKLIYGILLGKLSKNYKELQKIDL